MSAPNNTDDKSAPFKRISVRDAALAVAEATGEDPDTVEKLIKEKQAQHPELLRALAKARRPGKPDA